MRAKKSLGQNFLMHNATAERIVHASKVGAHDTVLEIGPGRGMLTRALLARVHKVIAVEADGALVAELQVTFAKEIKAKRLMVIEGDIRAFNPSAIKGAYALVANIPYYITGELLRTFLTVSHKPTSITFLVQKEVAVRIARSKKESMLSLSVKAYGVPSYAFTVPRGAFVPAPSVDSAVLTIRDINARAFTTKKEEKRFFELVHAGFAHKRKRLVSNLSSLAPKKRIEAVFEALSIGSHVRAEDVPLSLWRSLASKL